MLVARRAWAEEYFAASAAISSAPKKAAPKPTVKALPEEAPVSLLSEVGGEVVFQSPWTSLAPPKVTDRAGATVATAAVSSGVYSFASTVGGMYTISSGNYAAASAAISSAPKKAAPKLKKRAGATPQKEMLYPEHILELSTIERNRFMREENLTPLEANMYRQAARKHKMRKNSLKFREEARQRKNGGKGTG